MRTTTAARYDPALLAPALVAAALTALAGCTADRVPANDAPFVLPAGSEPAAAPFKGPSEPVGTAPPSQSSLAAEPPPTAPQSPTSPAQIAAPLEALPATATDQAERRRQAWLTEGFRCKAISTTRLRRCRFEQSDTGYRLRFPVADVVCQDVSFDERGDPALLTDCTGAWLRVPARNELRPDAAREVWSGSHSGWRWKSDRERYCCPGLWLEAPAALRD
jgi:hypothetical protein